jgi:hypothetical protein
MGVTACTLTGFGRGGAVMALHGHIEVIAAVGIVNPRPSLE